MRILVVSTSLNPQSRSRLMARAAAACLREAGADVDQVDLRQLNLPMCDGGEAGQHPDAIRVADLIRQAQGVILATPIYNFDANAAAKNLVELTGEAWKEKVVGFLCAAGGQGSYMSVMGLAKSLMLDFRCLIVPRYVHATGEAFDEETIRSPEVQQRIEELCAKVVQLARAVGGQGPAGAAPA